jgi:hypothetical protein
MRNSYKMLTGKSEGKRPPERSKLKWEDNIKIDSISVVGIVLGCGLDDRWLDSRQGLEIFLFTTASRPALETTQPPIQWVPGALSLWVKWPGLEADYSPPSNIHPWRGAQLRKGTGTTLLLPYIK